MWLSRSIPNLQSHLRSQKANGATIAFVPTMGALHEGHLSLIRRAGRESDISVCSIFVNPTQFNNPGDLEKYPRTVETDLQKLIEVGADYLFMPEVSEIYPRGTENPAPIDFGILADSMEGTSRPGHFAGMAQVVERLLSIVQPDVLVMGQKDLQQCQIVEKLIRVRGLDVKLIVEETVREADGLAMASRNVRLSPRGRKHAVLLSKALRAVTENANPGVSVKELLEIGLGVLNESPIVAVEYFEIRRLEGLEHVVEIEEGQKYAVLGAAQFEGVRILDNMIF